MGVESFADGFAWRVHLSLVDFWQSVQPPRHINEGCYEADAAADTAFEHFLFAADLFRLDVEEQALVGAFLVLGSDSSD